MYKIILTVYFIMTCALSQAQTIVAWGDSLTAGAGGTPWTTQFTAISGITTINRGVGGNTSSQIADRFFAEPSLHDSFGVIWAGRNNYTDPEIVLADIASMVSELGSSGFIILGVINGNYGEFESIGSTRYNIMTGLNSSLSALYGNRFIDIRRILIESHNDSDLDLSDHNRDIVPSSLRADNIHLNSLGYEIVANSVLLAYSAIPEPQTASVLIGFIALSVVSGRRQRA
jgi:hypothetical protein